MPAFTDLVLVGRVVKPQGRKGEVKVEPYTDREDRFPRLARAFVPAPGGGSREVEIEGCWPHKDHFVTPSSGSPRASSRRCRRAPTTTTSSRASRSWTSTAPRWERSRA